MTYVAKGTPPGYDVNTAADYLLSFNSNWPLLKQHTTGIYSGAVSHNLGYPPFHIIASSYAPGAIDQYAASFGVTSSVFESDPGSGNPRYYIFRLDLTSDFTAPNLETSTAQVAKNDGYVFKMSREGKSVHSTDMRDFSLHSNTKSPSVHKVKHGNMTLDYPYWRFTVPHGLAYTPSVFSFIKVNTNSLGYNPDRYFIVPPPVGVSDFEYTVDGTNVYVTATADILNLATPQCSVVILKDPLIKQIVNVSF